MQIWKQIQACTVSKWQFDFEHFHHIHLAKTYLKKRQQFGILVVQFEKKTRTVEIILR